MRDIACIPEIITRIHEAFVHSQGGQPMSRFKSKLNDVRVAAPCNADWDSMLGNERVRFCGQCKLNVYNVSEMTRSEAELLVAGSEGRLCVRYYRRRDGSIITQNCPFGLRALKRRLSRVSTAIGSTVLSFFAGVGAYWVADLFSLVSVPYHRREVMGKMAIELPNNGTPMVHTVTGEVVPVKRVKSSIRRKK